MQGHWLTGSLSLPEAPGKQLRQSLEQGRYWMVPGVFGPLISRIAYQQGFPVQYISGATFSAILGLPDLGFFTLTELTDFVQKVFTASGALLIVDADTGFGEPLNVLRTVRLLERAGASAIQIEDQQMPKKCGHLEGKNLISPEEMIQKIRAVVHARTHMMLIARTDARGVTGFDDAVQRGVQYAMAGADILFPEALQSPEEFATYVQEVRRQVPSTRQKHLWFLANMTEFGKTPLIPAEEFFRAGYSLVLYPVTLLRMALRAVEETLQVLKSEGSQESLIPRMMTRQELYRYLAYQEFPELDRRLSAPSGDQP